MTNEKIKQALTYVFLTVAALVSVFPLYWMLSAATNLSVDVSRGVLLPGTALISNFQNLLKNQDVLGAMINSFKYSVTLTV
ncbi:MAG: carbohydrate ABC transporter permease, partial [Clostridia bacterium]|nr:carbohydrate ABC transporter permease [Clostridia bacterium]